MPKPRVGHALLLLAFPIVLAAGALAQTSNPVDEKVEEIDRIARQKYPELPIVEARKRVADEISEKTRKSLGNEGQRAEYSADEFMVYFYYNTRTRVSFCRARGVDISVFATRLTAENSAEIHQVDRIYARLGTSYEPVWQKLGPVAERQLEPDMRKFASQHKTDMHGACERLRDQSGQLAYDMSYSVTYPEKSRRLLAFRP